MRIIFAPSLAIRRDQPVETIHPAVCVEIPKDDLTVNEMLECLIEPALRALGFDDIKLMRREE